MQVRSFAKDATSGDLDTVLWKWGKTPPAHLIPIDDEDASVERACRSGRGGMTRPQPGSATRSNRCW
jgi:hypothetical protein